jgi:hypothetical protein
MTFGEAWAVYERMRADGQRLRWPWQWRRRRRVLREAEARVADELWQVLDRPHGRLQIGHGAALPEPPRRVGCCRLADRRAHGEDVKGAREATPRRRPHTRRTFVGDPGPAS